MTLTKEQLAKLGFPEGSTEAAIIAAIEKTMKEANEATAAFNSLKAAKDAADAKVATFEKAKNSSSKNDDDDDEPTDKNMKKVLDSIAKLGETVENMNKRMDAIDAAKNSLETDAKKATAKATLAKYMDRIGGKTAKAEVLKAWEDKLVDDHAGTEAILEAIPTFRKSPAALDTLAPEKDDHENKEVPVSAVEGMARVIHRVKNQNRASAQ